MKNLFTYITLLLVIVFQTTVFRYLEVLHIIPNLVLVYVVCYSMYAEPTKATILAVVSGLLTDIIQTRHIGFTALIMLFVALVYAIVSSDYIKSNIITVVAGTFIATFIYECLYACVLYVMFDKLSIGYMLYVILLEGIYNMVMAFPMMFVSKYFAEDEIRSF